MSKYLAKSNFSSLGSVHDTKDQAEKQATAYRDWNDDVSGYYNVFGEHSTEPAAPIPMTDEKPSREQYLFAMEKYEQVKKELDEEINRLRRTRLEHYWDIQRRYINLSTPYNFHDLIKVTYLRHTGRRYSIKGIVYDVWITASGEIRPKLGNQYDKGDEIIDIEVLQPRDTMTNRQIFRILHGIDKV